MNRDVDPWSYTRIIVTLGLSLIAWLLLIELIVAIAA